MKVWYKEDYIPLSRSTKLYLAMKRTEDEIKREYFPWSNYCKVLLTGKWFRLKRLREKALKLEEMFRE